MLHVFLDTNILVRVVTEGSPGTDRRAYKRVKNLAHENIIRILVPEVVLLELQKHEQVLEGQLRDRLSDLKSHIGKFEYWSEIRDLRDRLLATVDRQQKAKLRRCRKLLRKIGDFLSSDKVAVIPLTPEVNCAANKRILSGRMPRCDNNCVPADALIVESLVSYFTAKAAQPNTELYFCSENHRDFAVPTTATGKDKAHVLHPSIAADLPPCKYFLNLDALLGFDTGYVPEAVTRPESHFREDLTDADWALIEAKCSEETAESFASNALPLIPQSVVAKRKELVESIQSTLRECRACTSWNDKSELKLCQWLEFEPEYAIPYVASSKLAGIKQNVERYLQIHQEADRTGE